MKLAIIIGSTREARVTPKLAKFIQVEANKYEGVKAELIDLKDYPMPFFEEGISPQYNPDRKPTAPVKKFLDAVSNFDGYVFVTPEYNRSYSAVLKNALDHLDYQLSRKPVMLASHGSTGGAQAVAHLRAVVPGIGAISTPKAVMLNFMTLAEINDDGSINPDALENPFGPIGVLKPALDDLVWFAERLNEK